MPKRRPRVPSSADLPPLPLLLCSLLGSAFYDLRVSVSTWSGDVWRPLHYVTNVVELELEHGKDVFRHLYNIELMTRARSGVESAIGEHNGFHDLFVPIERDGVTTAILAAGPFAVHRPTGAVVLERWHAMTGSHGRLTDPAFSRYLSATLSTLVLDGSLLDSFQHLMSCFARLIAQRGSAEALATEAEGWRTKLLEARFAERMWEAARSMVDERLTHSWSTPIRRDPLVRLSLRRAPRHAIVGLLLGPEDDADPVDAAVRRAAFQHACVGLVRRHGNAVCGQVGDHGVTLLADYAGSTERVRTALVDLATRAAATARRFGFRLHAGIAPALEPQSLAARYRSALGAAEQALSRSVSLAFAGAELPAQRLSDLRALLAKSQSEGVSLLVPRFNRYIEAVLLHSGHQLEATRAHLEAGLERLAEPLLSTGTLDKRSFDELSDAMRKPEAEPITVTTLVAQYRRLAAGLAGAVEHPVASGQERGMSRALGFIGDHLTEPLTLIQIARVAGFAPSYFSKLFKRQEGLTFDHYLQRLRLERAKRMLASTDLSLERVAHLSGFKSRTYFQRVFKAVHGVPPGAYQKEQRAKVQSVS